MSLQNETLIPQKSFNQETKEFFLLTDLKKLCFHVALKYYFRRKKKNQTFHIENVKQLFKIVI